MVSEITKSWHVKSQTQIISDLSDQIELPRPTKKHVLGSRCQVYSFGIVILELLTAMQPAKLTQVKGKWGENVFQGPDGRDHYDFLVTFLNSDVRRAVQMCDKTAWS